jgi:hypothetical protein
LRCPDPPASSTYIDALPFSSLWERIIALSGGGAEDVR